MLLAVITLALASFALFSYQVRVKVIHDFPKPGDLAASTYTRVRMRDGAVACQAVPVRFQRVRPGESLLRR